MQALTKLGWRYHPPLTVITTDEVCAEDGTDEYEILKRFSWMVKRVKNIDTTLTPSGTADYKMMVAMAEQADFFICDLSSSPLAEEIKKYFAHAKGVSLLDIGKNVPSGKASEKEPAELTSN